MPTNIYDVTQPPDSQQANLLGLDIRNLKLDVQQRMALISGPYANRWNPGNDAQPANWTGLLYFATDVGAWYYWNGSAWGGILNVGGIYSFFINQVASSAALNISIPAFTIQLGSVIDAYLEYTTNGGASGTAQAVMNLSGQAGNSSPVNSANSAVHSLINTRWTVNAVGASGSMFFVPSYGTAGTVITVNTTGLINITSSASLSGTGSVTYTSLKVSIIF